jgi:hypothetical protein
MIQRNDRGIAYQPKNVVRLLSHDGFYAPLREYRGHLLTMAIYKTEQEWKNAQLVWTNLGSVG